MSNNSTCIQPSMVSTTALPITYMFLCVVGLFGNSLAQWVFLTKIVVEATEEGEGQCYNRQMELGASISQTAGLIGTTFIGFSFLVVVTSYYSFVSHLRRVRTCTSITERDLTYRSVKKHLLIIQVLLVVCFLPYSIFKPIFYVLHKGGDCQQLNYLIEAKNILTCLASARSSTDPIIFLLLDKTFKKTLYNVFTKS